MKELARKIIKKYFNFEFIYSILDFKKKLCSVNYNRNIEKSKLGVTYNLFSGEELLEGSIKQIRKHVDYINIVYQKFSWYGDKASDDIEIILDKLKRKKLVDNIIFYDFHIFFEPNVKDLNNNLSLYIREKHSLGIDDLIKNKCTHCIMMDVDEFYDSNEFKKTKEYIIGNGFTHSAINEFCYYISPNFRTREFVQTTVPFILKLKKNYSIGSSKMPSLVDPFRCFDFNPKHDRFYFSTAIAMHHMTRVRNSIQLKLDSTEFNNSKNGYEYIKKEKIAHEKIKKLKNVDKILTELKKSFDMDFIYVEDKFGINEYINNNNKGE